MIKKRIAASVIVKNDRVVQSFSYERYLPLGSVTAIVQNLDRWGVDDIIVLNIDRTANKVGPNLDVIKKISSIPISTPLTYGGGIGCLKDALDVISNGAERVVVDNLFINKPNEIKKISEAIGSQAIIISIPVKIIEGRAYHFNYLTKELIKLNINKIKKYEHLVSELLIIDVSSEGNQGKYSKNLVEFFSDINLGLICYGGVGLSEAGTNLLDNNSVNSVVYGNILNYGELFFQKVKKSLSKSKQKLRRSIFRERI